MILKTKSNKIREAVRKLAGREEEEELRAVLCEVESVDEVAGTCVLIPTNEAAEIPDAKFSAQLEPENGFILVPAEGSLVYASFESPDYAFISLVSKVKKVLLKTETGAFVSIESQINLKSEEGSKIDLNKEILLQSKDEAVLGLGSLITIKTKEESLKDILSDLLDEIVNLTVTAPPGGGPTSPPINSPDFVLIAARLEKLLKE